MPTCSPISSGNAVLIPACCLFAGAPSVVFGQIDVPGARHTIVFYAHYDGQPVTPSEWDGGAPFTPIAREVNGEQRIYARSAGDDKAAIFAQLTALDALKAAGIPLRANIRFVWEGEEEAGSPHLEQILNANRDLVHGDVWSGVRRAGRPERPADGGALEREATRIWRLPFMGHTADCTAATTETGRRTQR